MGHHGGRVLPLYRDRTGSLANMTPGLLAFLGNRLGVSVTAEDVVAYLAALTAHPGYTRRFAEELTIPGLRVPLPTSRLVWARALDVGREVVWLHTFGERFIDPGAGRPAGPPRLPLAEQPRVTATIPYTPGDMPQDVDYNAAARALLLGRGRIAPVLPEVWAYEVSGMRVIKKWFASRRGAPPGRRPSPLDDVHSDSWMPDTTADLLDLLNVLGRCVSLEGRQDSILREVCEGSLVSRTELMNAGIVPAAPAMTKPPAVTYADDLWT
jgi:hypothetical protein